jgi:hypothetical protein
MFFRKHMSYRSANGDVALCDFIAFFLPKVIFIGASVAKTAFSENQILNEHQNIAFRQNAAAAGGQNPKKPLD